MFRIGAISRYIMVPNALWRNVTLKGISVFKWNEKLQHSNADEDKGLLVFRRSPDHLIRGILRFDLGSMVQRPSDPDGYFVPRSESLTFFRSLTGVEGWFEPDVARDLARELNSFIRACFRFDALTINCPSSPRLVLVVDLSYTEYRLVDAPRARGSRYEPPRSPPHGFQDVAASDQIENSDEDEDSDDEMEDGYLEEMKDIVRELRNYYNVESVWSEEEPLGLVEVGKKLEILVVEEEAVPSSPCAICLKCLKAEQVAVKTECGHFFHKNCSLSWFGSQFTCPMCRSNTRSIV